MLNYSNIFDNGLDYLIYRELINTLFLENKTTGDDHSLGMLHYTKMNIQRMNRVEKTTVLNPDLLEAISNVKASYNFLVISEGWCGDAAQILPVIEKIVAASNGKFSLKIVLRDKNLELMDNYLTNGGRAIPVLVVLDENKSPALSKWGPRPQILQTLLKQWKLEIEDAGLVAEQLHGWYAKDKTQATQVELTELLGKLG
ncbi:thioredoxin family protein [Pedobacter frigiditerrae]|uniref:thioredoxin family protein n=1 Tax=Pedobacter frigiditerrae TaxID=2530452 RepID=UPI00292EB980|nr:thioredoxin family protein [Pedobacter frigiditerrae]